MLIGVYDKLPTEYLLCEAVPCAVDIYAQSSISESVLKQ